ISELILSSLWQGIYVTEVIVSVQMFFFFFFSSRRRHTRSDRDWSSDVCSSDLFFARCRTHATDSSHRSEEFFMRCTISLFFRDDSIANARRFAVTQAEIITRMAKR